MPLAARKSSVPCRSGERVEYLYDATGRMLTRTHLGAVPDGGGDADRPFLARRLFVWDGARLAAEIGLNFLDQPIWRRSYLPGPSGLDDAPQVRVENGLLTDTPTDTVYAFLRDELGTVIGLVEDRAVDGTDPLPLLARYLYTPYGEAHLEAGPEPLEVSFDPNVGQVGDAHQLPPVPEMTMGGALRARFTLPLDPDTLADGVSLERLDGLEWLPVDPAEVAVGLDPDDPADLLVMLVAAWPGDTRYRLTLTTALTDQAARPLQLPPGMLDSVEVELGIPADLSAPTGLPREFPLLFDNIHAASSDLDGRFPGGQTLLFQGLWTDPTTGLAYARNRWYDARTASWLSEDPLGPVDSQNLYAFVGWAPHVFADPLGRAVEDPELRVIFLKIQGAANEAARIHGIKSVADVETSGHLGVKVHSTMQKLLADPNGEFFHPRILTEVEVSESGTIRRFGQKAFGESGSLIKDIVILAPGRTSGDVTPRLTKARDVTQYVVDLKIGKKGAASHQLRTLERYGTNNIIFRPFGSVDEAFDKSRTLLRTLKKRARWIRAVPLLGALGTGLTVKEAQAAVSSGELDRAFAIMTGVDVWQEGVEALGDATYRHFQSELDAVGASRDAKREQYEELVRTENEDEGPR